MWHVILDIWGYWYPSKNYTKEELQDLKTSGVIKDFKVIGFGSVKEAEIGARNLNKRGNLL